MKRRGFTLIELLAVIVILAIIAVIATPMVLNTIDDAKKGAAKSSTYSYIEEIETEITTYMTENNGASYAPGKYDISTLSTDLGVEVKGDTPTEGNVCIGSNGTVSNASIKMNGYVVSYDGKEAIATDSEEVEDIPCNGEVVLVGDPIIDKAKTLVYNSSGQCNTNGFVYNYMGGCYIKSGKNNNYVWYNGFMWRIMGINSDGTVRLITNENVTTVAYGATGTGETYATNEGYIHDWLNEYFLSHLNSTQSIIQEGEYFCSEATTSSTPRTECTNNNKVKAKVGLISSDEYWLSRYVSSSYLNINQYSWTMTPSTSNMVWYLTYTGNIGTGNALTAGGIRPVINVRPDAIITSGDGTTSNFYVLGEDKSTDVTGKISEKVTSGEYVKLEGKTYRVVSKNDDGVKLILDGFYEETEGTTYTMQYNETTGDNIFTTSSGIGQKLNNDVLSWLGLFDSDKIVLTTYYQGDEVGFGANYQELLKQSNGVKAKVGLIQAGDILANHSSTMLTKNYTTTSEYKNSSYYWTMNKYTSSNKPYAWRVAIDGYASGYVVTNAIGIRPVIVVRNDLNITSGNGTWKNPYEI